MEASTISRRSRPATAGRSVICTFLRAAGEHLGGVGGLAKDLADLVERHHKQGMEHERELLARQWFMPGRPSPCELPAHQPDRSPSENRERMFFSYLHEDRITDSGKAQNLGAGQLSVGGPSGYEGAPNSRF
jgi:hypothetical protein